MRVLPKEDKVIVEGVNIAKKHQKPDPGDDAGRHHRQGHADPRLERGLRPQGQADPDRLQDRADGTKVRIAKRTGR